MRHNNFREKILRSACACLIPIILYLNVYSYADDSKLIIITKENAGNPVLGQEENSFLETKKGQLAKRIISDGKGVLFHDFFQINIERDISFDRLYSLEQNDLRVCVRNGYIVAVISESRSISLSDSLPVEAGASLLVFRLGNKGLVRIQENGHTFYIYPEKGIAFADDGNDDVVDLYVVFASVSSSTPAPRK